MSELRNGGRGNVVILGSTSAIARGTAAALAREGYNLALAAMEHEENESIAADLRVRFGIRAWTLPLNALDYDGHEAFVAQCIETVGGELEGVVLCFGNMPPQEAAQREWSAARSTIEVNYAAAVSLFEKFAAYFEPRHGGWMIGVTSVAGDRGRMSNYIYGSAKAAFSIYLEGLRNRLFHAGVHVMTVKCGPVDTPMTYGMDKLPFLAQPAAIGACAARGLSKRNNVVYAPSIWRFIMLAIRHVPEWKFKRMKM